MCMKVLLERREFLRQSSALFAAGVAFAPLLKAQAADILPPKPAALVTPPLPIEFRALRRNVGLFNGRGGSIGWLFSPDALVAIDSEYPEAAALFLSGLPGRNGRYVDVLINTHHHPDHVGGNSVFRPVTQRIVAQELVPALQLAQSKDRGTANYQIYADSTFQNEWRFDAGDEVVRVKYVGYAAHTGSDSIVYFEKANVVHVADLVFNRQYPMTDRPGGCSIQGWIKALEEVAKTYPADAIYIFGHARKGYEVTGTRADVLAQRDYQIGRASCRERVLWQV